MADEPSIPKERASLYGGVTEGMTNTALIWSGILGVEVQPWQVPLCMIGVKLVRTNATPTYSDNSDDIEGYLQMFREIIGDDMVQARTATEFIEKTQPGAQPWLCQFAGCFERPLLNSGCCLDHTAQLRQGVQP
jgi:Domain of unknown function (DUF6378)